MHMAAAFAGGMFRGETCGAVTGALMAIGLACGGDGQRTEELATAFQAAFIERFGDALEPNLRIGVWVGKLYSQEPFSVKIA